MVGSTKDLHHKDKQQQHLENKPVIDTIDKKKLPGLPLGLDFKEIF